MAPSFLLSGSGVSFFHLLSLLPSVSALHLHDAVHLHEDAALDLGILDHVVKDHHRAAEKESTSSAAQLHAQLALSRFEQLRTLTVAQKFADKFLSSDASVQLLEYSPPPSGNKDVQEKAVDAYPGLMRTYHKTVGFLKTVGVLADPVLAAASQVALIGDKLDQVQETVSRIAEDLGHFRGEFATFQNTLPTLVEEKNAQQSMQESLAEVGSWLDVARGSLKDLKPLKLRRELSKISQYALGSNGFRPYFRLRYQALKNAMRGESGNKPRDVFERMVALRGHFVEVLAVQVQAVTALIGRLAFMDEEGQNSEARHIVLVLQQMKTQLIEADPAMWPEFRSSFSFAVVSAYLGKMAFLIAEGVSRKVLPRTGHRVVNGDVESYSDTAEAESIHQRCRADAKRTEDQLVQTGLVNSPMMDRFYLAAERGAFAASKERSGGAFDGSFRQDWAAMSEKLGWLKEGWTPLAWGPGASPAENGAVAAMGDRAVAALRKEPVVELSDAELADIELWSNSPSAAVEQYPLSLASTEKPNQMEQMIRKAGWYWSNKRRYDADNGGSRGWWGGINTLVGGLKGAMETDLKSFESKIRELGMHMD